MGDTLVHVTKWDPDFKMKTIHYPPRIIVVITKETTILTAYIFSKRRI